MPVFDFFSTRTTSLPDVFVYDDVPQRLRNQILWIWSQTLNPLIRANAWNDEIEETPFDFIHDTVCEHHGLLRLSDDGRHSHDRVKHALLNLEKVDIVLDIIELSFRMILSQSELSYRMQTQPKEAVETLNYRFRENGVGYEFDTSARQLIRVDSKFLHSEAVQPALKLLSDKRFQTANEEFLAAFQDYKNSDFEDCLSKCCSAMESVLKIICDNKKWPYALNETAQPLVQRCVTNSGLPSFFEQPIMLIATMRNRLSSSHGQGTTPKVVPEHIARFALHSTAAAVILLTDACK